MAHGPVTRPVRFTPPGLSDASIPVQDDKAIESLSLQELVNAISERGGGAFSSSLALDLVLNDIVEQAKLATNASAAAVALSRDGEMVCRATTGDHAPDLGTRLDSKSGLSGACVQSKKWQGCDDAETDPRVDAELCRQMGVRSILVFPVLKGDQLQGVVEIFSSRARAFSDREVQTLAALSRSIVENIERAKTVVAAVPLPLPEVSDRGEKLPDVMQELLEPEAPVAAVAHPRADHWMSFLTVAVILLALTLGWMIGRVGQLRLVSQEQSAPREIPTPAVSGPAPVAGTSSVAAPTPLRTPSERPETAKASAPHDTPPKGVSTAGLVVYDKGKVIFSTSEAKPPANANSQAMAEPRSGDSNAQDGALLISSESADQYVVSRVEPDYPEEARLQHVQGPVVLEVEVGKDGTVQNLRTLRGDRQLANAASAAVRQWRFKPYLQQGRPTDFQTQVTVRFRLP